jgi:exopolyphosphatase/guanosine-5'-triphosphate,3'-diphosphate pyrophosphatase
MAKRTAIIDIGSNSARLVIFEQTSHYGFHLICEEKSKVRIGEGAYEKGGYLQPVGIKRAFLALQSFLGTIQKYQANHTICVATSALRDAPNGKIFVEWIKDELNLSIEIIDGKSEAKYGAVAASNLLPVTEGITIDIGGGSSDMALIRDGHIIDTYSLNLGTVRLKELFFDKKLPLEEIHKQAKFYIDEKLKMLPPIFKHTLAIGIGGTARTLSKAIMKQSNYPLDKLHAFTYNVDRYQSYFNAISKSTIKELKEFNIKRDRFDTIREGTLIFSEILKYIGAKSVITSSVGVREGVYLSNLLKEDSFKFPNHINPSIESILSRFKIVESKSKKRLKLGSKLYRLFIDEIDDLNRYEKELLNALKLSNIGKTLNIYKSHKHAFYIAMQELNYSFTHEEILTIAMLLRMHSNRLINKPLYQIFKRLLPPKEIMEWLSFIYTLTIYLNEASDNAKIEFNYHNKRLIISSDKSLHLVKEKIEALERPVPFTIVIENNNQLPKHRELGIC